MSDVTHILSQIEAGDPSAAEQLLPLVYDELRKLAARQMAEEKPGQTLQATGLVHERLAETDPVAADVVNLHFFAGMTLDETAEALGVSRATTYRQWAYARALLRLALQGSDRDSGT